MNKKNIILTAIVGTIALATLSVSITLAWYGASNRLQINTIDVGIVGNGDLKVSTSTDVDSFVESLNNESFKDSIGENFAFEPVSSMYKNRWMDIKNDVPLFYDTSSASTPTSGEPELTTMDHGYFSKKLYLMANRDYYATLDIDKCIFENNVDSNFLRAQTIYAEREGEEGFNLTKAEIKDGLDNLLKCLRVSLLVKAENYYKYYIIDPTKEENEPATVFGGLLDNDGDGYFDTYSDVRDGFNAQKERETVYGEVNDRSLIVYDNPNGVIDNEEDTLPKLTDPYFGNSFVGVSKNNIYTYNEQASIANGLEFAKEESLSLEDIRNNDSSILIPCRSYVPTEIVVSIYLEGWDRECVNNTMGASFNTKLSFKLLRGIM